MALLVARVWSGSYGLLTIPQSVQPRMISTQNRKEFVGQNPDRSRLGGWWLTVPLGKSLLSRYQVGPCVTTVHCALGPRDNVDPAETKGVIQDTVGLCATLLMNVRYLKLEV